MKTKRGERRRQTNQRKRAMDLLLYLDRKRYVTAGVRVESAVNAIQNWLQREHCLGRTAK